jgi:hypothetical protein
MEFIVGGGLALAIGTWMVVRGDAMSRSTNAWQKKVNRSDPTPPPDYRTGVRYGGLFMMAAGVVLIILGLVM